MQNSSEKISADASYRLERLELKEEIRSNSSRGSRKSKFSRLSSKSSSSSKSALLGIKVPVTQAPVSVPVTQAPVSVSVTQAPVPVPVTQAPVSVPVTQAPVSVKQLCYEAQASTPISAFSSSVSQLSVPLTPSPAPVTQSSVLELPVSVSQSAAARLQSDYVSQIPATSIQSITQQPCVPRSLYGNSPLFVPPQPQLPQVSPTYFLPSSDNTQQINDALTKVTQLQRLPQAKPDVLKGEEKDKTRFFLRETAFDALVDSVPVSSQQELHLLYQQLEGRAKKVVEQLQFLIGDPERAPTEARKRLRERFGHSAILSEDVEVKLTNWPKVGNSDARGMQEFSDFLQQVEVASEYIPNLKIFEFSSKLQSLVDKLPRWFQTKWSTKVQRLQQSHGHNAFPSFSEFVKEVTFHSERMNIPQITQMPVIKSNHKSTTNTLITLPRKGTQGSSHQGLATTTLTTQASPIARHSSGTDES